MRILEQLDQVGIRAYSRTIRVVLGLEQKDQELRAVGSG